MSFETLDLLAGAILALASVITLHLGRVAADEPELDRPFFDEETA